MIVTAAPVRNGINSMAVKMKMRRAIAVPMLMEMHAVAPQPPQHMHPEPDQHDADGGFQRAREMFGNGVAEKNRRTGEHEQGDGVTQSPGQPMLDDVTDARAPGRDAGHRRDVIGFERVLHAKKKAEAQNSEHWCDDLISEPAAYAARAV